MHRSRHNIEIYVWLWEGGRDGKKAKGKAKRYNQHSCTAVAVLQLVMPPLYTTYIHTYIQPLHTIELNVPRRCARAACPQCWHSCALPQLHSAKRAAPSYPEIPACGGHEMVLGRRKKHNICTCLMINYDQARFWCYTNGYRSFAPSSISDFARVREQMAAMCSGKRPRLSCFTSRLSISF